jgi:hypothetical protein
LGKRAMHIDTIQDDFQDGIRLINLLEVIGGDSLGKYNRTPKMKIHNIQNVNMALNYLKSKDVKLIMISAEGMACQIPRWLSHVLCVCVCDCRFVTWSD